MIDHSNLTNALTNVLKDSLPEEQLQGLYEDLKYLDHEEKPFFTLFGTIRTIDDFLKISNELNFDCKGLDFDKEKAIRKLLYKLGWIDPFCPSDGPKKIEKDFEDVTTRFYQTGGDIRELRCIAQTLSLMPERLLKDIVIFWIKFYIYEIGLGEENLLSDRTSHYAYTRIKQDNPTLEHIINVFSQLSELNSRLSEDSQEGFRKSTEKDTLISSKEELFNLLRKLKDKRNDIAHSKRSGFAKGDAGFLRSFIDEMINDLKEALRICNDEKLPPSAVRISRLIIDRRGLKVECFNEIGESLVLNPIGRFAKTLKENGFGEGDYLVWSRFYPSVGNEPFIYERRF